MRLIGDTYGNTAAGKSFFVGASDKTEGYHTIVALIHGGAGDKEETGSRKEEATASGSDKNNYPHHLYDFYVKQQVLHTIRVRARTSTLRPFQASKWRSSTVREFEATRPLSAPR